MLCLRLTAISVVFVAANAQDRIVPRNSQFAIVSLVLASASIAVAQVETVGFQPCVDNCLIAIIVVDYTKAPVVIAAERHSVRAR